MAEALKTSTAQTMGAGSLGSQLDQLDNLIGRLGSVGDSHKNALDILLLMDQIDARMQELNAQGASIKAEEGQYESSCAALKKEARRLVRDFGGAAALHEERALRKVPESAWWWFLDDYLAQKNAAALKNQLKIGAVVVAVVIVLAVAYQLFLAPSPETVARYDAINGSQALAGQGQYAEALAQLRTGLAAVPGDPELLIMEGVVYSLQGSQADADAAFADAKAALKDDETFYIVQSQDYLTSQQPKLAEQSARNAILVNPNSAKGYFILGSAQEIAGDTSGAYDSYNKAVQLADASGDSTISVQAKIKLGYMMQGGVLLPEGTPGTPTPQ